MSVSGWQDRYKGRRNRQDGASQPVSGRYGSDATQPGGTFNPVQLAQIEEIRGAANPYSFILWGEDPETAVEIERKPQRNSGAAQKRKLFTEMKELGLSEMQVLREAVDQERERRGMTLFEVEAFYEQPHKKTSGAARFRPWFMEAKRLGLSEIQIMRHAIQKERNLLQQKHYEMHFE